MRNAYEMLRELVEERCDITRDGLARMLGKKGGSSVQRYLEPDKWNGKPLRIELVQDLDRSLVGKGTPPITRAEVWALADLPAPGTREILISKRIGEVIADREISLTDAQFLAVFDAVAKYTTNEADIADSLINVAVDAVVRRTDGR